MNVTLYKCELHKVMRLVCVSPNKKEGVRLGMLKLTSNILEEIKNGQKEDLELVDRVVLVNQGKGRDFRLGENSVLIFVIGFVCRRCLSLRDRFWMRVTGVV